MVQQMAPRRRVVATGGSRRTIAAPSGERGGDVLNLDDRPLAITLSHDGRNLVVALPWELWIVDARSLATRRTVALNLARPTVAEGWEGALWIGGQHLYRGNIKAATANKVGSKLGGYVDHVCMVRDDLLCGVGPQGEILWDIDRQGPVHKRKSGASTEQGTARGATAIVASSDGRAVFADGSATCWVIDPNHPEGYAKLQLAATSPVPVPGEAIVSLGKTGPGPGEGRVILAARDGAVAWTGQGLRLAQERKPASKRDMTPLAVAGDARWIYVLRGRGVLQRFLISQPPEVIRAQKPGRRKSMAHAQAHAAEPAPEPLPLAQEVRLEMRASCMAMQVSVQESGKSESGKSRLILGGGRADDTLGRLWQVDPETLDWGHLALEDRVLAERPPPPPEDAEPTTPERPSFIATRNKPAAASDRAGAKPPKISEISVDDIVGAKVQRWLSTPTGTLVERPIERDKAIAELLPADALLLPAMVRFSSGLARPALLLWPGVVEDHPSPTPPLQWLVWGDQPRAWMALETPQIRQQKWARADVFPLQIALAQIPEGVPGRRAKLDPRWGDREHFSALAKECKRLLKVLW